MILTLTGIVREKSDNYAIVEAGGVGYQVFMNAPSLSALPTGKEVRLWTHEHIREDARDLWGFAQKEEYRLFKRLLDISGVGPRTAGNFLALGPVVEIEKHIETSDAAWLCRVPGVGKKIAQKIILELRGKLVTEASMEGGEDVVSALVGLGYARDVARQALNKVADAEATEEGRLRAALKLLGRK